MEAPPFVESAFRIKSCVQQSPVMRIGNVFLFLLVLCFASCSCSDEPDDVDAAMDATVDAPNEGEPDSGPTCTSIFSTAGGAPAGRPTSEAQTDGETLPNPQTLEVDTTLFSFSVQAGEMEPTSTVLWTRVGDLEGAELSVRVWPEADKEMQNVRVVHQSNVTVEDGGFVHHVASDLEPGVSYLYTFGTFDEGTPVRSSVGRFRTAYADDDAFELKLAALTCTGAFNPAANEEVKPYPALSKMAQTEVDAILHLGDISYNDGAQLLAQFHAEWEETLSQQGYLDLLPSAGMYAIWDDHEVDDEWSSEEPSEDVRTAGRTAFNQFLATKRTNTGRLWTSYRWGSTAEFFLLDTRSERVPSSRETSNPIFVSEEQLKWLQDGLRDSTAHFKVVMTSVSIANLHGEWDTPFARNDRWEGYGAQREALLDFIVDNEIDNVWFLAGDIHSGYIGRLEKEGHPYARMWEIVVGPGASNVNPITIGLEEKLIEEQEVYPCEQFVYFHGRQHVETYLTFDPGADTIHVELRDGLSGESMYDAALRQEQR